MATDPAPVPRVLEEVLAGDSLGLVGAARVLNRDPSTVFRYGTKGARARGAVVRLEMARVGASWRTSRAALARFVAALTATADPAPEQTPRSPAERARAAEAAGEELKKLGS